LIGSGGIAAASKIRSSAMDFVYIAVGLAAIGLFALYAAGLRRL
jgi:hypothetical protein